MKAIAALTKRLEKIEEAAEGLRPKMTQQDRWYRIGCLLRTAAKRSAAEKGMSEEEAMRRMIPPNLREYMEARERGETPRVDVRAISEEMQFLAESFKNYQAAQVRDGKQ